MIGIRQHDLIPSERWTVVIEAVRAIGGDHIGLRRKQITISAGAFRVKHALQYQMLLLFGRFIGFYITDKMILKAIRSVPISGIVSPRLHGNLPNHIIQIPDRIDEFTHIGFLIGGDRREN